MRKQLVTMYTFAADDVLYYVEKGEIKSVTITSKHLDKLRPKEILGDYILKPNEKVEQRRDGKLILWKAFSRDKGLIKSSVNYYVEEFVYEKVNSPFVVDKELLKRELKRKGK